MNPHLTLAMLLLIGFCILAEAATQLCFKRGSNGVEFAQALRSPFIWAGVFFWLLEVIGWIYVLENVPISIAFPIMSLVYVVVVFGGAWFLREHVTRRHMLGALFITAGVACVGASGI